jgi:pyruvate/2-oxoglutarate dehydrogenase complex dihydrolipoamide acyltransferase (E2) component
LLLTLILGVISTAEDAHLAVSSAASPPPATATAAAQSPAAAAASSSPAAAVTSLSLAAASAHSNHFSPAVSSPASLSASLLARGPGVATSEYYAGPAPLLANVVAEFPMVFTPGSAHWR